LKCTPRPSISESFFERQHSRISMRDSSHD
jgi:hypothetical protein